MEQARVVLGPTRALCDIITAEPLHSKIEFQAGTWERQRQEIQRSPALHQARAALDGLHPLHFPVAFPEVFLRGRAGFDVIIGHPPWEKATIEEHAFRARYFPGLRALPQREAEQARDRPDLHTLYQREDRDMERLRHALSSGAYPGMGTGDPETYKAFCWRFWRLARQEGGGVGVVLPRSAMSAKGSADFRKEVFPAGADIDLTAIE
jgi:hypothetical protein